MRTRKGTVVKDSDSVGSGDQSFEEDEILKELEMSSDEQEEEMLPAARKNQRSSYSALKEKRKKE